jgi:predicted CxxxxCH...CXXCH cytochrome family protein
VHVAFTSLATARGAFPAWDGARCSRVACHGANLPDDPEATPAWSDGSGAPSMCGACHGVPPPEHTPSTSCNRGDCHGAEIGLDASGQPFVSPSGKALHIDGVIESAR